MKNRKPREKRASFYDAHFYNILDYFILAVLVAGVLIFILYPLLCMIRQSFVGEEGFSTEVYKSIFSANLQLVKNSVFVGVLSAFFSTILGLLVSICVWTAGKKLHGEISKPSCISQFFQIGTECCRRKRLLRFQTPLQFCHIVAV